jgi:tetraacyldisaccharide 4'-kinase
MEIPVFSARLVPDKESASALAGKAVLAFAGIGHPEKFFATLAAAGAQVAEARPFPDHHRYSPAEAGDLLEKARARNLVLVTTEKDQARMHGDAALAELARTVRVLPVRLVFNREAEIRAALADALARARG